MVSKAIRKTPPKPNKPHRGRPRRRNKSPTKTVAAVSSLIHSCHRRLIKIFSKLARIATPHKKIHNYQVLPKTPAGGATRRCLFSAAANRPLPPQTSQEEKPTIVLDLDETLVHSKPDPPPERYDFVVRPVIDGVKVDFYVSKRPYVDEFLDILSKKFEIVVFTAGIEEYASLVLSRLDRKSVISHRLYRDSCREIEGKFVKDLRGLGRDLKRVFIVDDNPNSYVLQPENAVPISPFVDDVRDGELRRLVEFFEGCDGVEDLRDAVKVYLSDGNEQGKL
ncbi:hypothetical protein RHMOL_Rhmol13G0252400 [Rhododendron molle]|uniref:Uncharacterized protein n=1 Tax=Rhododendron molle TaxID=49168 RepID=A0ACC0LBV7_RHOML|nr:hypothetical protein RHMOL_Rhmol13G0252400 [Rhododendron molle]